jgi:putative chitinase
VVIVTVASLVMAGIAPNLARVYAPLLADVCARYEIDTPRRVAHFVAQCGHESIGFSDLEESMYYRRAEGIRNTWPSRVTREQALALTRNPEALANHVYSNRMGNGGPESGDGWTYIGRGLIQLTFRDNYAAAGDALGQPYEEQPKLVATPEHACLTAGFFWWKNRINAQADTGSVEAVTKKINPPMKGIDGRRQRTALALEAFE